MKEVKVIWMDNGGENIKLVQRLNSNMWKMYPKIKFTTQDTPQHNHLVKVSFATVYGCGRAIMANANILKKWKAFETATRLDGLVPATIDGQTKMQVEHWCGKCPKFANHLRKWGKARTVKLKTKTTPKLEDRGKTCVMVGCAGDYDGNCYEMLNMDTKRILQS